MKAWLGAIGRACIEFPILLALAALIAGAASSLANPTISPASFALSVGSRARELLPLASAITLFLSFFSFETSVRGRAFGYLGLLLVGTLTLSAGIALHRIPLAAAAQESRAAAAELALPSPGIAYDGEGVGLWYRASEEGAALDAIAVDFRSPYPRMSYAPRAPYDGATGMLRVGTREFPLSTAPASAPKLIPEASAFEGSWIWERLSRLDEAPIAKVAAVAAGFLLLALGFRFLGRLTAWPLANAMLAVSGLFGLLAGDAALGGTAAAPIAGILAGLGLVLEPAIAVAALEGAAGILLAALDLLLAPRGDRRIDGQ